VVGRDLPAGGTGGYMIRLRHEALPTGLSALVRRRSDGDLEVIVSTMLSAGRQRSAVRAGLRAMRPARRGAGPLRVPALILIALAGTWLRAIGRLLRLHLAATTAVASTVMAAAVVIAVAPHLHGPASAGRNPAVAAPAPGATGRPKVPGSAAPSAPAVVQPLPSGMPVAARSPARTTATPAASQPLPVASALQPPPSAPSPAASGTGGHGICVELLGIWVCV
jgi:hypothetical protein